MTQLRVEQLIITRAAGHKYYADGKGPFPGATGICQLQDAIGGSDGLLAWAVNGSLSEMATRLLQGDQVDTAIAAAKEWKNKARDIGSAVHACVDAFNRGLPIPITEDTAPHMAHYGVFAHRHGLKVVGSERYVINTSVGFGGTYDLLGEVDGELALLDVKTGKAKPSQRLQLAGLSMGEWHGEEGQPAEPMPKVNRAYILLLSPTGYELVPHEITDADREHFVALVDTHHRVRGWLEEYIPTKEIAA